MKGYETVWLVGDEFVLNTWQQHYKNKRNTDRTPTSYLYSNFEVTEITSTRYGNDNNILSRIRNGIATSLNQHTGLPRLIVFILDDDIITSLTQNKNQDQRVESTTKQFEYVLNNLFILIERVIATYKDYLPAKCKRENIPHLLWMAPPSHKYFTDSNNEKRAKYTNALQAVVSMHENTSMLRLVKFWDHSDSNLFLEEQYRYTTDGLDMYWLSIDAAIRFWMLAISKKFDKSKKKDDNLKDKPLSKKMPDKSAGPTKPPTLISEKSRESNYHYDRDQYHGNSGGYQNQNYSYGEDYYDDNRYQENYDNHYQGYYDQYQPKYKWNNKDFSKASRRLPYNY